MSAPGGLARRFWSDASANHMSARILPDRNTTWPLLVLDLAPVLPTGLHHRLDSVVLRRPRKTCRHRDCRSESLIDLWCASTVNFPAHIVESAIQGAFPDPLALSANMFSTMPTGFRSFTHADRVVHSVFRSAGRGPDRRSQVEFRSGRILTSLREHSPPNRMARHRTLRRATASASAKMPRTLAHSAGFLTKKKVCLFLILPCRFPHFCPQKNLNCLSASAGTSWKCR